MKLLNGKNQPDKTWLDRDKKVARHYEQVTSKKRIGRYLRRWL